MSKMNPNEEIREVRLTASNFARLDRFAKKNLVSKGEALRYVLSTELEDPTRAKAAERKVHRVVFRDIGGVYQGISKLARRRGLVVVDYINDAVDRILP